MSKVAEALVAIDRLYGETTVSKEDTRADLCELHGHIEILIGALDDENCQA